MGSLVSFLVFQPPAINWIPPSKHIWLTTSKGAKIPAIFLRQTEHDERKSNLGYSGDKSMDRNRSSSLTILFSHGNAEDLGAMFNWIGTVHKKCGVNVLAYDYTGYGKSQGNSAEDFLHPSEDTCYADIKAAYKFLTEENGISSENIIIWGRSLGTGPSCYLASELSKKNINIGGLILQSPLCSVYRVVCNFRFTLFGDMFPNIDYIPHIDCKILIIHGTMDEIIPFWHGESLFLASKESSRVNPFWIEGAGHNNLEFALRDDHSNGFFGRINEFIDEVTGVHLDDTSHHQHDHYQITI